jgi:hypothetical protein
LRIGQGLGRYWTQPRPSSFFNPAIALPWLAAMRGTSGPALRPQSKQSARGLSPPDLGPTGAQFSLNNLPSEGLGEKKKRLVFGQSWLRCFTHGPRSRQPRKPITSQRRASSQPLSGRLVLHIPLLAHSHIGFPSCKQTIGADRGDGLKVVLPLQRDRRRLAGALAGDLRVRPWTGSVSQPFHHGSRVIFQSADG